MFRIQLTPHSFNITNYTVNDLANFLLIYTLLHKKNAYEEFPFRSIDRSTDIMRIENCIKLFLHIK